MGAPPGLGDLFYRDPGRKTVIFSPSQILMNTIIWSGQAPVTLVVAT